MAQGGLGSRSGIVAKSRGEEGGSPARRRGGFSLIELLLVLATIAILAGLAMVNFRGAREGADKAADFHKENTRRNTNAMHGDPMDNQRVQDQ